MQDSLFIEQTNTSEYLHMGGRYDDGKLQIQQKQEIGKMC